MENKRLEHNLKLEKELNIGTFEAIKIFNKYSERGFVYRVVGGMALSTIVAEDIKWIRKNGTIRDIDLIVFYQERRNQNRRDLANDQYNGFTET